MDEQLVAILSEERHLPKEALRKAVKHPESIAEPVLRLLDRAAEDPDALSDEEANLLFWGLHVLGAARDARVFQPFLRLLRQDVEAVEGILGDAVGETLPKVLASTFDGDAQALHRFILDSTIDDFLRGAGLLALGFLTREGRLDRDASRRLLERFDEARAAVEEAFGWNAWEEAIAYLGFAELAPRVEAARRDGRITDEVNDLAWFRGALRRAAAEPPDLRDFDSRQYGYLDDPVEALHWTAETYGQPVKNPFKAVGRNDPCPCGSGKKYKKCCLDAGAAAASPVTSPKPPPLPGLH